MQVATIDQISRLAERIILETENLSPERKKKRIVDEVYELLVLAYIFGIDRVLGDIQRYEEEHEVPEEERERIRRQIQEAVQSTSDEDRQEALRRIGEDTSDIPVSVPELYETIYKPVAGETFEERLEKRLREGTLDTETLKRIMETDYHRCEETGAYNTAIHYGNATGTTPYKIWRTMKDDRVRDQHWWAEGQMVPIDGLFTMPDGSQAPYPGMFGVPDQDCNCRCWVAFTFK